MTRRPAESRDRSLRVSLAELNRFNKHFGKSAAVALDFDHQRYLSMEKLNGGADAVWLDYGLEEPGNGLAAIDDRGTQQSVVHFSSSLQQHLLLALNCSWRRMSQAAQFRQIQILLFLAWGNPDVTRTPEMSRKQLLRLEWEGVDELGMFEAEPAAHPHWQTDQWLAGYDRSRGDLTTRLIQSEVPREFALHEDVPAPPHVRWMRAVHLAAAARWADEPWRGEDDCSMHARPPKNIAEIENWSLSALRYIAHQFRAALDGS